MTPSQAPPARWPNPNVAASASENGPSSRGRQPDIDHGHVWPRGGHGGEQVGPVVHGRRDLETVGLEHPGEAVPQQEKVFGDDNTHGISMVTAVGPPDGLLS